MATQSSLAVDDVVEVFFAVGCPQSSPLCWAVGVSRFGCRSYSTNRRFRIGRCIGLRTILSKKLEEINHDKTRWWSSRP